MIDFRCRCSHPFRVPDEEAGTSLQCPSCGLLVDVPTLEELPGLSDDGTSIALGVVGDPPSRGRPMQSIRERIPTADRADTDDRRLSLEEFLKVGAPVRAGEADDDDGVLDLKDDPRPAPLVTARPKYDPVTGELIRPLDVAPTPRPVAPPEPAVRALTYERKHPGRTLTIWMPLHEMFALPNLVVCAVVTAMCYANMVLTMLTAQMFLPGIFVLGLVVMTIAHFANVVDETGPTGTDEMPTPLRGGSLSDDMLRPLAQVMGAYAIAYSPIVLLNLYVEQIPWEANVALTLLFFLIVPATLLTTITSGAANNLIPSRMFSVIGASGRHYWIVTAMGFLASVAFVGGLIWCLSTGDALARRLFTGPMSQRPTLFGLPNGVELALAPLVMFVGVYLAHVFCWQLGLMFRFHHEQFNWVLQRHQKSERNDVLARLHGQRQRQLEQQAAAARANLERRAAGQRALPVAAPVAHPVAHPIATAVPVAHPVSGDLPIARPAER